MGVLDMMLLDLDTSPEMQTNIFIEHFKLPTYLQSSAVTGYYFGAFN